MNIDDLVERIIDPLHKTYSPDGVVELNSLAHALGALDILYGAQNLHGFTQWTDQGPHIRLRLAKYDSRRRFSLAHECGHLIMDHVARPQECAGSILTSGVPKETLNLATQLCSRVGLEKACDHFARELLVPRNSIPSLYDSIDSVAALLSHAARLRVSPSMLAYSVNRYYSRLDEASQWTFLRLARDTEGCWFALSTIGMRSGARFPLELTDDSAACLSELSIGSHIVPLRFRHKGRHADGGYSIQKRSLNSTLALSNPTQGFASPSATDQSHAAAPTRLDEIHLDM